MKANAARRLRDLGDALLVREQRDFLAKLVDWQRERLEELLTLYNQRAKAYNDSIRASGKPPGGVDGAKKPHG